MSETKTLRDEFALVALQGWLAAGNDFFPGPGDDWEQPSKEFYRIADAMLEARNAGRGRER